VKELATKGFEKNRGEEGLGLGITADQHLYLEIY
jgi:hypothetical protein